MKILFLGKNPGKPKALSFGVLILISFIFLSFNISVAYFYIEYKKERLFEIYGDNPSNSQFFLSKEKLDYENKLE